MALNFSGFKQKLFSLMKKNEGTKVYELSWAGTASSGWSFGWVQFDLGAGKAYVSTLARITLKDILINASKGGKLIIPPADLESLYQKALTKGGRGLAVSEKQLVNSALGSAYGIQKIDDATSIHLDNLISNVDSFVNSCPTNDQIFLNTDLGKLWLCDIKNQGFTLNNNQLFLNP